MISGTLFKQDIGGEYPFKNINPIEILLRTNLPVAAEVGGVLAVFTAVICCSGAVVGSMGVVEAQVVTGSTIINHYGVDQ